MNKRFLALLMMLYICTFAMSQTPIADKELSSLIDVVKMLRISNETNFNKATKRLANDNSWTPMDETGDVREGKECKASEKVPGFKLNRILSKVNGSRKYVSTHGDMVNGEDTRYDYSLYERAIKPKAEVRYKLKGREGKQTFVVVAYNVDAKFDVSILRNGKKVSGATIASDGIYVVEWSKNTPSKATEFELVVKNRTTSSQSFVLINHNTRKK